MADDPFDFAKPGSSCPHGNRGPANRSGNLGARTTIRFPVSCAITASGVRTSRKAARDGTRLRSTT